MTQAGLQFGDADVQVRIAVELRVEFVVGSDRFGGAVSLQVELSHQQLESRILGTLFLPCRSRAEKSRLVLSRCNSCALVENVRGAAKRGGKLAVTLFGLGAVSCLALAGKFVPILLCGNEVFLLCGPVL